MNSMIVHTDTVNAFIAKLQFWGRRLRNGNENIASFERLSDILSEDNVKDRLKEQSSFGPFGS